LEQTHRATLDGHAPPKPYDVIDYPDERSVRQDLVDLMTKEGGMEDYSNYRLIGEGSVGQIYRAIKKKTAETVCLSHDDFFYHTSFPPFIYFFSFLLGCCQGDEAYR
jgi:hypothetical protein